MFNCVPLALHLAKWELCMSFVRSLMLLISLVYCGISIFFPGWCYQSHRNTHSTRWLIIFWLTLKVSAELCQYVQMLSWSKQNTKEIRCWLRVENYFFFRQCTTSAENPNEMKQAAYTLLRATRRATHKNACTELRTTGRETIGFEAPTPWVFSM